MEPVDPPFPEGDSKIIQGFGIVLPDADVLVRVVLLIYGLRWKYSLRGTAITKWLLRSQNERFYRDYVEHMNMVGYSELGEKNMQHKWVLTNQDGSQIKADVVIVFRKYGSTDSHVSVGH